MHYGPVDVASNNNITAADTIGTHPDQMLITFFSLMIHNPQCRITARFPLNNASNHGCASTRNASELKGFTGIMYHNFLNLGDI